VTATIKRRARRSDDPAKTLVSLGRLELNVPGHHNLLNALATVRLDQVPAPVATVFATTLPSAGL